MLHESFGAAQRAAHVVAHLKVVLPQGYASELRIEGHDFIDLRARHAEVRGEIGDVFVGDVAALFLDATERGNRERPVEAGRIAALPHFELGNQALHQTGHRSHSPPIMFTEPNVVTMSAS